MRYKFSKYNVLSFGKRKIIFNTVSLSLAVLDEKMEKIFREENTESLQRLSENEIKALLENGFIISEDTDEIKQLKEKYWDNKFNNGVLNLSIMTTMSCNFNCVYCFEKRSNSILSSDIQDGICEFIENNIEKYRKVHVDWYGGEPLLQKKIILSLSKRILDICQKYQKEYSATVTTNGYLLDNLSESDFTECRIDSIQVTLDGTKQTHDSRRMLVNGDGTYDKILENLCRVKEFLEINLRINVDYNNIDDVESLLQALKEKELEKCILSIKGVVSSEANPCEADIMPDKVFSEQILKLYMLAINLGISTVLFYPLQFFKKTFCIVDTDTQFIISPEGGIYKCGENYDKEDPGRIGEILKSGEMHINTYDLVKWNKDPFAYPECVECEILPLCWGGCQLKRNVKKLIPCYTEYKNSIEEILQMYYLWLSNAL